MIDQVNRSRVMLIKILVGVVAIAALVGGYLLYSGKYGPSAGNETSYKTTTVPSGSVVSDFPQELLIEKGTTVSNSYSLAYVSGSSSQPVVTYTSNWSMLKNVVQFGAYLRNNGWIITHEADPLAQNTFYYASKGKGEVNITLAQESGKIKVTISYILK